MMMNDSDIASKFKATTYFIRIQLNSKDPLFGAAQINIELDLIRVAV